MKSNPNPTPTDLREAQDAVDVQIATVEEQLGKLRRDRLDAIINGGSYGKIDEITTELNHLTVDRERLDIAKVELNKMLADVALKVDEAERDRIFEEAYDAQREGLALLEDWPEVAAAVVAFLQKLVDFERRIAAANVRLSGRGDPRSVEGIEQLYWLHGDRAPSHLTYPPWSLVSHTRLPSHDAANEWLWPNQELPLP